MTSTDTTTTPPEPIDLKAVDGLKDLPLFVKSGINVLGIITSYTPEQTRAAMAQVDPETRKSMARDLARLAADAAAAAEAWDR